MELPSMVQRSGDTLIVRSVVSGNPIYMDQGTTASAVNNNNNNNTSNNNNNNNNNMNCPPAMIGGSTSLSNTSMLEQFEQFKRAQDQLMQQQQKQQQQQHQQQQQQSLVEEQQRQQAAAAMELKEEGLPQCKIKRNYSCNYCTYFTQNPRSHLTHLRDVHGEKIVINKCQLCLYASRHYQKLVRHMKMVHGCTDNMASGHGQARGKRGINREARKRKLEECIVSPRGINAMSVEAINAEHQIKSDMEQKLQREIEAFKKQQEEQQKCQQQQLSEAIFAAAYEQQLRVQRELDREALKAAHSSYEHPSPAHNPADSPSQNKSYDQLPALKQQSVHTQQIPPQRSSIELTPSPSGSNSSPPPQTPSAGGQSQPQESLSAGSVTPGTSSDEPSNNRLMKCSLCDFTTLYRNLLLEHENEDHCNAKFYRCEKCSYVTHIKARFSKHVKYHSMPMIKCVTCDFRTPYKWNLDRHMKNHGGAGPFKCAACDFTADIKQSLTVHEMNHHVPPVGHAAGMTLARRRLKVGGTDLNEDFFSDSADMLEDHFNNNNMDEYDEMLMTAGPMETYESKRLRYDDDEPTDLSQKGGSSDTSSVHNSNLSMPKVKKPLPNLIPITKESENILNLSSDLASRSSLSNIASIFFNQKEISEMLQPMDKTETATSGPPELSPTTTIISSASGRSLLNRKAGSFFDKIKSSSATNENLICPCGHMAKCLSESIIHRKTCTFSPLSANDEMDLDDDDHDEDGDEGRLEIDFTEDDEFDKQSHSALNLSVSGSTRCRHCRHRCKSSADLLNHLKICSEANSRCDSLSGDSCAGSRAGNMGDSGTAGSLQHPMENRVFIWNKLPRNQQEGSSGSGVGMGVGVAEGNRQQADSGYASLNAGGSLLSANNDENSYYGVETAPGYGEVTKKMTPEEEAANSSLKKVYKCPHCSFWASTASRFHVHIVGHLNKKPFECSLCSYRSNWRWDITKHIRLKTIRDPSHKNARVLMNDETGRRNYTKYNKYITLMKVTEEDGDPKLMKSGEMTPNQVASLAFINDYNNKQQQGSSSALNPTVSSILNGVREDITIEPVPPKSSISNTGLLTPLLASSIPLNDNQQHNDNDQSGATLITPSVSISAYKKDLKSYLNGEFTQEIRHEGNKEVPYYKCRKCNYTHTNREPLQFHTLLHVLEERLTIASTNTDGNTSMPVTSNSNVFLNKTAAAMGLSQQQQKQSQLSNLIANGLPDQANNLQLSSLALALAGKSPLKSTQLNATPNILEHGEQKASQNEASAQNTSSTSPNQLTTKSLQNQQQLKPIHATSSSSVTVTGVGSTSSTSSPSLQHLLTSPRGSISQKTQTNQNDALHHSIISNNSNTSDSMVLGTTLAKNKNGTATLSPSATPTTIVTTTTTTSNNNSPSTTPNHLYPMPMPSPHLSQFNNDCDVDGSGGGGVGDGDGEGDGDDGIGNGGGILLTSGDIGGIKDHHHRHHTTLLNNNVVATALYAATTAAASSSCSASLLSLSNQNYTQNQNQTQNQKQNQSHSSSSSNNSNSNNLGILVSGFGGNGLSNNNNNNNCNNNNNYNNNNGNGNSNSNANGNGNHNNSNLLTHDTTAADRRDPSPYRCGHCHQVSNWKHVIQRHCRLKHAGVINIETLDRTASADRHAAPIYKPLVNGASNEANNNHIISNSNIAASNSQLNLTLKALQQQQQQQQQQHHNNVLNNNNNNTNIINNNNTLNNSVIKMDNNDLKFEQTHALLNSQLTSAIATLHAANTPQEIMACAAAAHRMTGNTLARLHDMASTITELMLKKQLLQNDQIEITRVSSSNHNINNNNNNSNSNNNNNNKSTGSSNNILTIQPASSNTNLAQLLDANNTQINRTASPQSNTKSKQQKCPLCTYICDSKSQMNYHISLHKPTQYECHKCTFVCAKKQHLSAHMRTVHQINQNHIQPVVSQVTNNISANSINMDLSLALQMATAAQKPDPTPLSTPLAIDLSSSTIPQSNQIHQGQLPPEYQYRMIYYCPKCPARYAQKHNDPLTARKDLDEHRRQHEAPSNFGTEDKRKYHCDYCDYRAMHESIIQTHRHVHTTQYQEKCNELYKNCKEDSVYRAPKLMHITAARKPHLHETIWVVDHDLNDGHQPGKHHQNSVITSSSQSSSFETGNSLLKKQLESKQSPAGLTTTTNEEMGKNNCKSAQSITVAEDITDVAEAEDSNTASTSASVATGDLAHDNELQAIVKTHTKEAFNQSRKHMTVKEKCEHCPFESCNETDLKSHLQQHICVSKQKLDFVCDHCDYTTTDREQIDEHTRVHFNGIEKLKDVAFFTSYDKLEISIEQKDIEESEEENADHLDIKQELLNNNNNNTNNHNNNNNEEDRINENLKETTNETAKQSPSMETFDKQPPKCAKIILYKNDGCLSIKKEASEQSQQQQQQQQQQTNTNNAENISDRLRRRISRQGAGTAINSNEESPILTTTSMQSTSHKTILVHAKTGQVISRN